MGTHVDGVRRSAHHLRDGFRRAIGGLQERLATGLPDAGTSLLVAWSTIGIGTAVTDGAYAPSIVILLAAAVLLLVISATRKLPPATQLTSNVNGGLLAIGTVVFATLVLPAGIYGTGTELYLSHTLTAVAALLVGGWVILRLPRGRLIAYLTVGIMAEAGVAMILSSPRPSIDTWYMLQAAGHGLSHGHDIYTLKWTSGIPGELSNKFTYLPGSAVLLWPFHALFGDVRYGLLAAMVLTAVTLIRVSKGSDGALIACLFLLYPKFLFGLEQSWVDPLSLAALCLMGYTMMRDRRAWAVVAFAIALSCKQYNWLLIPFALLWKDFGWRRTMISAAAAGAFVLPWAIVNLHAFIDGAFTYNLDLPLRRDSLSLYTTIVLHGHNPGLWMTGTVLLLIMARALWRLPRTTFGFFLGSATIISAYALFNRLSFFDAWEFAGGLTLIAFVFGRSAPTELLDRSESTT